jgi:hypothetical protein
VTVGGQTFTLEGREGVFAAVTDFAYVPRDAGVEIASQAGGRFALPSARAATRLQARYVAARDVPVELRGAGRASRQVNNFCAPDAFQADRLIAVEVLTPSGNWSSYPPHKHDEEIPARRPSSKRSITSRWPGAAWAISGSTAPARGGDRRLRRDPHGRRDRHAARLSRTVHGGSGV